MQWILQLSDSELIYLYAYKFTKQLKLLVKRGQKSSIKILIPKLLYMFSVL